MSDLKNAVIEIALHNIEGLNCEEARYYLENEAICEAGSVSGLIYCDETKPFAKEFYDEIIGLMDEFCIEGRKDFNWMAWFAFEAVLPTVIDQVLSLSDCEKYGD